MSPQTLPSVDAAVQWLHAHGAQRLRSDSRQVQVGDAFIAWPGLASDGRRFVPQAVASGAVACLVDAAGAQTFDFTGQPVAALAGLKPLAGPLAAAFLGEPSRRLQVIAITGTNGKTSSSWWLAQALQHLGRPCAVAGTLGLGVPPNLQATGLTTPDPVVLQQALREFADAGLAAVALEASSIGLAEQRLAGTHIAVALFTNFTRDHLDYHTSMAAYWRAKRALFDWPGLGASVVNIDDAQGQALADELAPRGDALWTCSSQRPARVHAQNITLGAQGLEFTVREGDTTARVHSQLVGAYNVDNLLGVIGVLRALGIALADAAAACASLQPVPGRLQRVGSGTGQPELLVDYAHTPDALEKALAALRPLARARGGKLWCVFGCGGNRDATKRPLMGAIAARGADHVVLTSDNPRNEDPAAILAQIHAGLGAAKPVAVLADRRAAIALAVKQAAAQDVILVAGKGHEDYQEVRGQRAPFNDADVAAQALAWRQGAAA